MVCPTISGTTVDRRDHVLITRLSPRRFISTTFSIRWSSTNGPFLIDLGISYRHPLLLPRRRTMSLSDGLGLRVRPSFLPHGLTGWRPPLDLPSPPPRGWSTGFMATPRTEGRFPSQRLRPAFPHDTSSCSGFPTTPTVARQWASTILISPEGMRSVANPPSFASNWTPVPAERAILAPAPGFSSTA